MFEYNVFHYYINKRKRFCKMKHVQRITLTLLKLRQGFNNMLKNVYDSNI